MKNRDNEGEYEFDNFVLCKYCVECNKPCPYGFFNDDIYTLTEEQCRKRRFVQNHLEPLMKALCVGIISVNYQIENGEEIVITKYSDGGAKRACVSADSLAALCRDVLKTVG